MHLLMMLLLPAMFSALFVALNRHTLLCVKVLQRQNFQQMLPILSSSLPKKRKSNRSGTPNFFSFIRGFPRVPDGCHGFYIKCTRRLNVVMFDQLLGN